MRVSVTLIIVLGLATLVFTCVVIWQEQRRRPRVVPPADPEEAGRDPFNRRIAIAIALLSVVGSILALRASSASGRASGMTESGMQSQLRQQQLRFLIESRADFAARLTPTYEQHRLAAQRFQAAADAARPTDAQRADTLESEARIERVVARSLFYSFPGDTPDLNDGGTAQFDRDKAVASDEAANAELRGLDPAAASAAAADARSTARWLVGVGAIFVVALFFLTMAHLGYPQRRLVSASAGAVMIAVGLVCFVLVEL